MRVVVTCGPSYAAIDQVRRITNLSTGELGILLSNRLTNEDWDVVCFKGVGATCALPVEKARVVPFATNEHLRIELEAMERRGEVAAVFHAAALADYRVKSVRRSDGAEIAATKIPSGRGELTLTLEPVPKLIGGMRALFPHSRIVGWKYELEGGRTDTVIAADKQIVASGTDACVLNGAAYGIGFGFHRRNQPPVHCGDKPALCEFLASWLRESV